MYIEQNKTRKLVTSALLMAIGIILPFFTMQIPAFGNMLLPMHIPVIICGFLCGGPYGLAVGLIVPLLRSVMFGMPIMMPIAFAMSLELATYGFITGILHNKLYGKRGEKYVSLIVAMIVGRIVWGTISFGLFYLLGNAFTWKIFAVQAVGNAIPGIILQLILIPILITSYESIGIRYHLSQNPALDMKAKCANRFKPAQIAIEQLLDTLDNKTIIIAIDGKCASGKTSLGYYLQSVFDCNLYHMDDFFLREEQRSSERLLEVGGNVDYERFQKEVLVPISLGKDVMYRKYNCAKKCMEDTQIIEAKKLNIIEGSYSLHPIFEDIYTLKIFVDIDDVTQKENIRKRNGDDGLVRFVNEWIPKENAYFDKYSVKDNCIVINW